MRMGFFKDFSNENNVVVGGKGASLIKMYNFGLNIPNGYIVCSDVFNEFLIENDTKLKIKDLLHSCNICDNEDLENKSKEIKNLILNLEMSDGAKKEILEKYQELNSKYVAVRSSATSEDGSLSAWAGQLETYLNITEDDIIDNIKKCWASLFNARAIYYRIKKQDESDISVAVVVQQMIQSEVSGIAFSMNPVTNNDEIVIEAVYGLGEAIVSGSVNPDNYIVDKNKNTILNKEIKEQTKMLHKNKNNVNEWINVSNEVNNKQKLDDETIIKLCDVIKKIEKYYKYPVDIEWGIEKGNIYILQCRPITTIKNDETSKLIKKIKDFGNWNFYVTRIFNWYLENTQIYGSGAKDQDEVLGFNVATKNNIILNGDEYYQDIDFENNCKIFKKNFESDMNFFDKFAKREFEIVEEIKTYINKLKKMDISNLSKKALIEALIEFDKEYSKSLVPGYTRPEGYLEIEFKEILKSELRLSDSEIEEIFVKVATCPNYGELAYSEEPLALLKIAKLLKDGKENIDELLNNHIDKYSWIKAPVSLEDTCFTKDDYIERLEFLKDNDIDSKIDNILKIRKDNDLEYESVLKKYNFSKRVLKLAKAIRDFIFLRTYTTEYSDYLFYLGKQYMFKEISKRCNCNLDDLIMLSVDEILDLIKNDCVITDDMLEKIDSRRRGFAILWLDGEVTTYHGEMVLEMQSEIEKTFKSNKNEEESSDIIKGTPANKGKVIGKVKILLEYKDIFNVEKGDIIVASMTTPDYVSAMEKAIGFITDEGGITCHAAIISREFDVPCIVGTNNATKKLKDGQLVELDAYNGIIKILNGKG